VLRPQPDFRRGRIAQTSVTNTSIAEQGEGYDLTFADP